MRPYSASQTKWRKTREEQLRPEDKKQLAIDWLKRTVALGNVNYPYFQRDKNYDALRDDPEYQTIMARVRQRWEAYKKEFDAAP